MKEIYDNDLNRAVSLLNFEKENRSLAMRVLLNKYKIPKYYLSLLIHKIFIRLGNYDFSFSNNNVNSTWDLFHLAASEEIKAINFQ